LKSYLIVAAILILLGGIGLAYDRLSVSEEIAVTKTDPAEQTVESNKAVSVPPWLAWGSIVIGSAVCVAGAAKQMRVSGRKAFLSETPGANFKESN